MNRTISCPLFKPMIALFNSDLLAKSGGFGRLPSRDRFVGVAARVDLTLKRRVDPDSVIQTHVQTSCFLASNEFNFVREWT